MKFKITLVCFVFTIHCVNAQVTIGSDVKPREGTVLDIKENEKSGHLPNADGGIGLPRVALVHPSTLTIDIESKKKDYVGVSVYNTKIDPTTNLREGIYCWDGAKWKLTVSVDDFGEKGQLLKSNGDGTFDWSTFSLPDYKYHKPTQISVLDGKVSNKTYNYSDLISGGSGQNSGSKKPKDKLFDNDFVYTVDINIQSDASKDKYLLLGIAIQNKINTIKNYTFYNSFWQLIQLDVFINTNIVQTTQRLYPSAKSSNLIIYFDLFTIVPLNNLPKDSYELKLRISNIENTFYNNDASLYPNNPEGDGCFRANIPNFYSFNVEDVNFVLYEED